ncbi:MULTISPECIES: GNAT family N-acetyltransferase [unclassified Actinopolyspora]|uniref:GNAT family N-acetyltransferase n=1 Tax=unclassified Actinopolyspora TaxID=2639451 RepID=UPI0013F5F4CA|nr:MULTISPECIES: GNAT family N-acetyltransferase [unclassified Actinopolyspora]NHD19381.1 N-acetyltransferase [Actinopolyspora sp. BKK2]NHE78546.1 N-acetyltransferase [Actinopolyspora sp. BKK1]
MSEESPEVAVARSADRDRYEITVDGRKAGHAAYLERAGQRVFYHTEIDEEFGGRGLGSVLVGRALAETGESGFRIVPVCPFVARYLERHHEVDDLVDAVTPDVWAAVRERTG